MKTLLTIIVQCDYYDFSVQHWYADSAAVTEEMSEWLREAAKEMWFSDTFGEMPAIVQGFLGFEFYEFDDEPDQAALFGRGKELGDALWTKKQTAMSFEEANAAYTVLVTFM